MLKLILFFVGVFFVQSFNELTCLEKFADLSIPVTKVSNLDGLSCTEVSFPVTVPANESLDSFGVISRSGVKGLVLMDADLMEEFVSFNTDLTFGGCSYSTSREAADCLFDGIRDTPYQNTQGSTYCDYSGGWVDYESCLDLRENDGSVDPNNVIHYLTYFTTHFSHEEEEDDDHQGGKVSGQFIGESIPLFFKRTQEREILLLFKGGDDELMGAFLNREESGDFHVNLLHSQDVTLSSKANYEDYSIQKYEDFTLEGFMVEESRIEHYIAEKAPMVIRWEPGTRSQSDDETVSHLGFNEVFNGHAFSGLNFTNNVLELTEWERKYTSESVIFSLSFNVAKEDFSDVKVLVSEPSVWMYEKNVKDEDKDEKTTIMLDWTDFLTMQNLYNDRVQLVDLPTDCVGCGDEMTISYGDEFVLEIVVDLVPLYGLNHIRLGLDFSFQVPDLLTWCEEDGPFTIPLHFDLFTSDVYSRAILLFQEEKENYTPTDPVFVIGITTAIVSSGSLPVISGLSAVLVVFALKKFGSRPSRKLPSMEEEDSDGNYSEDDEISKPSVVGAEVGNKMEKPIISDHFGKFVVTAEGKHLHVVDLSYKYLRSEIHELGRNNLKDYIAKKESFSNYLRRMRMSKNPVYSHCKECFIEQQQYSRQMAAKFQSSCSKCCKCGLPLIIYVNQLQDEMFCVVCALLNKYDSGAHGRCTLHLCASGKRRRQKKDGKKNTSVRKNSGISYSLHKGKFSVSSSSKKSTSSGRERLNILIENDTAQMNWALRFEVLYLLQDVIGRELFLPKANENDILTLKEAVAGFDRRIVEIDVKLVAPSSCYDGHPSEHVKGDGLNRSQVSVYKRLLVQNLKNFRDALKQNLDLIDFFQLKTNRIASSSSPRSEEEMEEICGSKRKRIDERVPVGYSIEADYENKRRKYVKYEDEGFSPFVGNYNLSDPYRGSSFGEEDDYFQDDDSAKRSSSESNEFEDIQQQLLEEQREDGRQFDFLAVPMPNGPHNLDNFMHNQEENVGYGELEAPDTNDQFEEQQQETEEAEEEYGYQQSFSAPFLVDEGLNFCVNVLRPDPLSGGGAFLTNFTGESLYFPGQDITFQDNLTM